MEYQYPRHRDTEADQRRRAAAREAGADLMLDRPRLNRLADIYDTDRDYWSTLPTRDRVDARNWSLRRKHQRHQEGRA